METAAKRTPVVEAYNYFPLASTPDAQKTYNENNILEINNQSILANVHINRTLEWGNKTKGYAPTSPSIQPMRGPGYDS